MAPTTPNFFAIVAGVGAGTGRSVALRFAKAYPVVLISRKPENYTSLAAEIKAQGGTAVGVSADTADPASLTAAFDTIRAELPGLKLAAAIYNAAAGFPVKPFLETTTEELDASLGVNA